MKILLTGGAGFMGSAFIRHILKNYTNYHIVNFDKLTYAGQNNNLLEIESNPRYSFIQGDITDSEQIYKAVCEVDAVLHYAAETRVDRSIENADCFASTNLIGTLRVLEAVNKAKIKKMIQISTDEVYGSISNGSLDEASAFLPNNPYSASKAGADLMCRAFYQTHKTPVVVTHGCNNYGPYQHVEKFIPLCISYALQNKKIPIFGDGSNIRTWIFMEDYCKAIDMILHKGEVGAIYNIGTQYEISNLELATMILSILGKDTSLLEFISDRVGHDFRYSLSYKRLSDLGWEPKIGLEEGIAKTINWYQANENWWKNNSA